MDAEQKIKAALDASRAARDRGDITEAGRQWIRFVELLEGKDTVRRKELSPIRYLAIVKRRAEKRAQRNRLDRERRGG